MNKNESTPLSSSRRGTSNRQGGASEFFPVESAGKAATYLKERAEAMSQAVKSGDTSIRALALVGGVAMVVTGILRLLGRLVTVHLISTLFTVYTIIFGVLVILLEGKKWLPIPQQLNLAVRKYALFLEFVWGRGVLYFFIGSLQFSLMNILDGAVGGYMCIIGIFYIITGRATARKLAQLRRTMYTEEELRIKFYAADIEQKGTIDFVEFKNLMQSFGIVLERIEAESAFIQLDKSGEGKVTFDEFLVWWNAANFDADQNTQFLLSV